jgi:hypothetical protein
MEVIVAMTVFGVFLAIFFTLTAEMRMWEKRLPVNYMRNPQIMSVIARMRRDVLDAYGADPYHDEAFEGHEPSEKVLILDTLHPTGTEETVVWDFREAGVVRRISYHGGVRTQWASRGLPKDFSGLKFDVFEVPGASAYAIRLQARDEKGQLAIDQILQPRAHE